MKTEEDMDGFCEGGMCIIDVNSEMPVARVL